MDRERQDCTWRFVSPETAVVAFLAFAVYRVATPVMALVVGALTTLEASRRLHR